MEAKRQAHGPRPPKLGPGWTRVRASDLVAPARAAEVAAAPSETIQRGQPVRLERDGAILKGRLRGYDYRGRPVVQAEGERRIGAWEGIQLRGPAHAMKLPTAGLPDGALVRPPAKLQAALDACFDIAVAGPHTAREYIDALHREGYFVYLTGGAIRDAVRVHATRPDATVEEIAETLKDVDVVTTAPPPAVRRIAARVAPELPKGAVWSPDQVDQFGSVLIGGPKALLPNPEGLDVTSMRSEGAFEEQVRHPDTGEMAHPYTFDHDLTEDAGTRDFACNALYYDPLNRVLVDPTGFGIADAQKNLLRVARVDTLDRDDNVALRFFKFRIRGFEADGKTRGLIRRNAKEMLWKQPRWRLTSNLTRIAPKTARTREDVQAFFGQLEQVMKEDGLGELFRRRVAPQMDRVAEKIERRYAREPNP